MKICMIGGPLDGREIKSTKKPNNVYRVVESTQQYYLHRYDRNGIRFNIYVWGSLDTNIAASIVEERGIGSLGANKNL